MSSKDSTIMWSIKPRTAWYGVSWPGGSRCNHAEEADCWLPGWFKVGSSHLEEAPLECDDVGKVVWESDCVDCSFLFLLNQLRVILAKGGIMPDVVQTNHPINYFQRKTSPPRHLVLLSSIQVWIGGTMHPCTRLAKRPVQRRKAAISLLGEREFYEDFEDFF